jgi:hypothetical protein
MSHNFVTKREDFGTMLAHYLVFIWSRILRNSSGVVNLLLRALKKHEFIVLGDFMQHFLFETIAHLNWHLRGLSCKCGPHFDKGIYLRVTSPLLVSKSSNNNDYGMSSNFCSCHIWFAQSSTLMYIN